MSMVHTSPPPNAGNPIIPGWYADPEARLYASEYWIFPTYSAAYSEQTFFDAFSSPDLLTWTKHPTILNITEIPWSTNRAAWAPSVGRKKAAPSTPKSNAPQPLEEDEEYDYYMYFSTGDGTGIGVAVSPAPNGPGGPYTDALGAPLVNGTIRGAEAIDAQIFQDEDSGRNWLYFGGWGHAMVVEVGSDMVSLMGEFVDITPRDYVEGPWVLKKGGTYYFMFSVGGWGDNSYGVSYVTGPSPTGPFSSPPIKILQGDDRVGTSTGHNSVFTPDGEDYYIVYHRRPVNETERDHRVVCVDRMFFDEAGSILPVNITVEGVGGRGL
ncbi:Arabinanase/levansucrase/invertase [Aspergillus heteromorphus CBS 117.55]|uniref:Arabinanase/levansucrase/invertase n=1 Tax=Aspergillus heteromorphus CBS 117.55 TaxID=1448321 RepID=A0A317VVE2_9EURO|nr:Arabinanase/levansucrase/invertase [Aspergillus heteromorphus CBS 117.55]PWY78364.1 Arabinanase/levansucrase/invertase [Aspergillus heteromorphus CBS 117.55]